ncbi:hypothetical protein L9F63_026796 [Diploptera punctata]|uniref:AAA+ ATPase domain-containing protein n=1 Tax=Diploptera punctata TaxID=6984 RepID=A0AAD8AFH4_DIPPU|nr:hypothetical protein L9F63_026796 [Diploptera punctata]
MKAAGDFDDVVLTLGNRTVFLQLKHKGKNDIVLKLSHLTMNKNFKLSKYLDSYLDIKKYWQENNDLQHCGNFEDAIFVIYTNAAVSKDLTNTVDSLDVLNIINTGDTYVSLTRLFENLPKYKTILAKAIESENVADVPELWDVAHQFFSKKSTTLPSKKQLQETLEQIECLGDDLTQYQSFISQLYLCTGQKAEKDLDQLIRHEIQNVCGTDSVLQEFMEKMIDWWRYSNSYLTVKTEFFQDIIQKIAVNVIKKPTLKVQFSQNECHTVRQISQGNRKIFLNTKCMSLSCAKVLQSFQTDLLIEVNTLQNHLKEVLAVLEIGMYDVLVLEGEIKDPNIMQRLASIPNSKSIIIISSSIYTKFYHDYGFVSVMDTFTLSQLDSVSQHEILEHEIIFQGFPVKLNSLVDTFSLESVITADLVVQLFDKLQIGNKLDDLDLCYIPRTFLKKVYISDKIFSEQHITLAITGESDIRLEELMPSGEKFLRFDKNRFAELKNCKYFIIEDEADFTSLCELKDNIYWIHGCAGEILYKKSKGDIAPIIKHLQHKCVRYVGAEEVLNLTHQVVLVIAEPGMGKTTEMRNIAHILKQKDPSTWIIIVDLNHYTSLLSQNQISSVEFLEEVAKLNTDFQKYLFQYQFNYKGNFVILLDGFDEISPKYSKIVFDLLTEFSASKVKKIFITSRPVMKQDLEDRLATLAFSFDTFTVRDQTNFLMRYWNQFSINSPQLPKFISALLQLVGTWLNDKFKKFTGIPLQTRLLAEVFQDEALYFCETGIIRLPKSLDVLQLYDKFIDKKWDVYCKKLNIDMNIAMLLELIEFQKMQFLKCHMVCALFSYLDDNYFNKLHNIEDILKENQDFVNRFNHGEEKTGIVNQIVDGKAVFVHRTFAEYFVAMWFSKHFNLEIKCIGKFYLNKNFEIIRIMLDRMVAQETKLHISVLNKDLTKLRKLLSSKDVDVNEKDKGGRSALHMAVINYLSTRDKINDLIIETLLELGGDVNCEDKVLCWRPLRLAEELGVWFAVEKLLEKKADSKDLILIKDDVEKQVHNSLQGTSTQGFVLPDNSSSENTEANTQGFVLPDNSISPNTGANTQGFVLPDNSISENTGASEQGFIPSDKSNSESETNLHNHISPFLQNVMYTALSEGYVNLLEYILKCGVRIQHDFTHKYGYKTTMLHIAIEHKQLEMVRFLLEQGADVEMCGGWYKRTPLMWATEWGHVKISECIIEHGASVNATTENGYTALSLAVCGGKHEVGKILLEKGADIELSDKYNKTPLMRAAERGHIKAVELLIKHGANINAKVHSGFTALSLAASGGYSEVVKLLLKEGADIELCVGEFNRTPLMQAAISGYANVVEILIHHGASINTTDKNGFSTLQLAISNRKHESVEVLLQNGADVEACSDENCRPPLIMASMLGSNKTVQLLLDYNASINAIDDVGYTAVSLASSEGKTDVVETLLKRGANTEIRTHLNKRTSLILAAIRGRGPVMELLIKHGVPINETDKNNDTALTFAAYLGLTNVVELLLERGADTEVAGGQNNRTPLIHAAACGYIKILELLLKFNASVNARDENGETSISLAASEGKSNVVELLLQSKADIEIPGGEYKRTPLIQAAVRGHFEMVELLIEHGASINACDSHGNTALTLAARECKIQIVELLLKHISDSANDITTVIWRAGFGNMDAVHDLIQNKMINSQDEHGYTALSVAARVGKLEVLQLLLENKADVEISDMYNVTPLIQAVICGKVDIVEVLINHRACINVKGFDGQSPLLLAVCEGKTEILQMLLKNGGDIETCDELGTTLLMQAVINDQQAAAEVLIKHGACINARDKFGITPLTMDLIRGKKMRMLLLQYGAST